MLVSSLEECVSNRVRMGLNNLADTIIPGGVVYNAVYGVKQKMIPGVWCTMPWRASN